MFIYFLTISKMLSKKNHVTRHINKTFILENATVSSLNEHHRLYACVIAATWIFWVYFILEKLRLMFVQEKIYIYYWLSVLLKWTFAVKFQLI